MDHSTIGAAVMGTAFACKGAYDLQRAKTDREKINAIALTIFGLGVLGGALYFEYCGRARLFNAQTSLDEKIAQYFGPVDDCFDRLKEIGVCRGSNPPTCQKYVDHIRNPEEGWTIKRMRDLVEALSSPPCSKAFDRCEDSALTALIRKIQHAASQGGVRRRIRECIEMNNLEHYLRLIQDDLSLARGD